MDAAERRNADGPSPMELLSQNLNLERVVQQKTESLQRQGEDLRKALYDLQRTQARLLQAQKLEAVGQLAAGIAHEINTPIQYIGTNIAFLEESFQDIKHLIQTFQLVVTKIAKGAVTVETGVNAEKQLEELDWNFLKEEIPLAIQQSIEGIRQVTTIVQAMKEFSHPGNKERALNDVNKILETAITVARHECKSCAEISTHLAPDLPPVFCLADEIGQVFLNLLVNAAHSIIEKGGDTENKGIITISSRHLPESVEICIEDTGTGIPENIRSRIFDPFFTTKSVGKGSGQGLAIAHDVIENKHGGRLIFTSQTGKGTAFFIQLPTHKH